MWSKILAAFPRVCHHDVIWHLSCGVPPRMVLHDATLVHRLINSARFLRSCFGLTHSEFISLVRVPTVASLCLTEHRSTWYSWFQNLPTGGSYGVLHSCCHSETVSSSRRRYTEACEIKTSGMGARQLHEACAERSNLTNKILLFGRTFDPRKPEEKHDAKKFLEPFALIMVNEIVQVFGSSDSLEAPQFGFRTHKSGMFPNFLAVPTIALAIREAAFGSDPVDTLPNEQRNHYFRRRQPYDFRF